MYNKPFIPENVKDPKIREYLNHLHEIIEKQNKENFVKDQIFRIKNLNFRSDLKNLVAEVLAILWDDQFCSIRIVIKNFEGQTGELLFSDGLGNKSEAYKYLDDQIEDQLGKPGILYISDTAKIHSIKFVPGNQFPKTILGVTLGDTDYNLGLVWFACENQKTFSKFESDSLFSLVEACSQVIQNCLEWNEKNKALSFRNEILDQVNLPILIISSNDILFSNLSANQIFGQFLKNINESRDLLKNILKTAFEGKKLITVNKKNYRIAIVEQNLNKSKPIKAALFYDETQLIKQHDYLSVVISAISQGLRSPLNLILGLIKMLPLVGDVNDHQKEYISGIQLKTEESLTAIEDLLELERIIEGDGLKLKAESLKSLVDTSISLVSHLAKQKHISIENKIFNLDEVINVDKALFTQMLANIFEFAISQTKLNCEITLDAENNIDNWKISIKDKGNGFSQVEVERLNSFENIYELSQPLRLARKIIDFHGGTFLLQSDLGKGNTYLINIPG